MNGFVTPAATINRPHPDERDLERLPQKAFVAPTLSDRTFAPNMNLQVPYAERVFLERQQQNEAKANGRDKGPRFAPSPHAPPQAPQDQAPPPASQELQAPKEEAEQEPEESNNTLFGLPTFYWILIAVAVAAVVTAALYCMPSSAARPRRATAASAVSPSRPFSNLTRSSPPVPGL